MQLNKVFKGLVIALPVVTLMACTSTNEDAAAAAAEEARIAQEQAAADAKALEDAKVQTGTVERLMSPEEEMKKELDELQESQTVYFDFDRASVKPEFYAVLDAHAAFLVKNSSQSIVIEGHTDSRGTPEYNIALGESRAKSVQTYLLNAGVSSSQISVVSYGEEKPVNNYNTAAAFAENRRGVLVYQ
ncbi:peptidoglycan-associated lipoprotein Pal [Paraglaciecola sp. 2405UD69-4]|uniref:peptidoglycan-associated lipoprotein Pal n=1 Tax=Paraglaciecola sp. 2405UD69-4 TaxID=3391836 RepID=UPI0039C9017B